MRIRKRWLFKLLLPLSILHVFVLLGSYVFSTQLPSVFEIQKNAGDVASSCYWINAVVFFPRCGDQVFGGAVLELFYGYWVYLWVCPTFAVYNWSLLFSGVTAETSGLGWFGILFNSIKLTALSLLMILPIPFLVWKLARTLISSSLRLLRAKLKSH